MVHEVLTSTRIQDKDRWKIVRKYCVKYAFARQRAWVVCMGWHGKRSTSILKLIPGDAFKVIWKDVVEDFFVQHKHSNNKCEEEKNIRWSERIDDSRIFRHRPMVTYV
jgi:hypothetical protein